MLNVLMFGWELPPYNSGGMGVACMGLAQGLSHMGANISFALPRKMGIKVPFMEILDHDLSNVSVTAINSKLRAYMTEQDFAEYVTELKQQKMEMYGRSLYEEAIRFGEMAKEWSKSKPHEVIHAHDWMTYPAGIQAQKISGRPFVAHVHATEYDRTGGNVNSMIAELEYQGLKKANKVVAVSEYTKRVIQKEYGVAGDKIAVVHNGINLSEFTPSGLRNLFPDCKVVLFVGRLTRQKGVSYFLQAAKEVLEKEPKTIFVVAGAGDMYEQLVLEAASLGVGHRTLFTGFVSGEKLRVCYEMADVFVMPSVSEPYGIVALEAIASGTPVIISRQSGVGEALEFVKKVDYWDVKKMGNEILQLMAKPELTKKMADGAIKEAEKMSWEKSAEKMMAVYRQLI